MIDTIALGVWVLAIGNLYYNHISRLTDLINTSSKDSQAYRILRWVQGCSIITFLIAIQVFNVEPLLALDWQTIRPVLGILGLVWLVEPLRNIYDLDLTLNAISGRLVFWGGLRVLLLFLVPWSMMGIVVFDYAIVKHLQIRIQHQTLFDGQQLNSDDLKQHAITLGKDGVMIAKVDADQDSQIEIHL